MREALLEFLVSLKLLCFCWRCKERSLIGEEEVKASGDRGIRELNK